LLTQQSKHPRYARAADEILRYWLTNLVDDRGMLWWGWHRHYDVFTDKMTGHAGNHHEIHVQQIIWPELWRVDAEATLREIEGIWQWHAIDKSTGEINRHADGHPGCDFAMSGGEMLAAFAFAFHKTGKQVWLDRARLVADYYWQRRETLTNLIANRPNAGRDRFDGGHFDTSIAGLHCRGLLLADRWTGDRAFRDYAAAYLSAYARLGFDEQAGQFWGSLRLDGGPVPGPRVVGNYAQYEPRGHIDLWEPYAAGYECPIYAAQAYAMAFEATDDPELLTAARRWADCIAATPPGPCQTETWYGPYARQWAPHGTYAGLYGRSISFALHLAALTGEPRFTDLAKRLGRQAIVRLYYRGLFRGHPCKPYYESIDGVGYLLVALLQLDAVTTPEHWPDPPKSWENG